MRTTTGLMPCSYYARGIWKSGFSKFSANSAVSLVHQNFFRRAIRHVHASPVPLQEPHLSASRAIQFPESPLKIASASGNTPPPEDSEEPVDSEPIQPNLAAASTSSPPSPLRPAPSESFARAPRSRGRPRGSSSRRGTRTTQSREPSTFKPCIPDWFIERNVTLASTPGKFAEIPSVANSSEQGDVEASLKIPPRKIHLSPYIQKELEAHSSAALLVPSTLVPDSFSSQKAPCHVHIRCPRRGAIYFLDGIVEDLARELEADIVRLDGQDVEELLELLIDPVRSDIGMGPQIFFTNLVRSRSKEDENEEMSVEEGNEEMEEEEGSSEESTEFRLPADLPLRLFRMLTPRPMYTSSMPSSSLSFPNSVRHAPSKENAENKVSKFVDVLLSAPSDKRKALQKRYSRNGDHAPASSARQNHGRTIVYLRDLQSVLETPRGQIAHHSLLQAIQNRRRLGERIMLIVSDDGGDDIITMSPFANLYYQPVNIPPPTSAIEKRAVQDDRAARTREINLRRIQSAIRQRCQSPYMEFNCPAGIHLDGSSTSCIPQLDQELWEFAKIQRVASIAMGNHGRWQAKQNNMQMVPISLADIAEAVGDMGKADQERAGRKSERETTRDAVSSHQTDEGKRNVPPFNPINSKDCTKHEQKLLSGVIDPDKIHVGFSDIRAPESTIQTLKVLVSLPLRRPDAFSYGVLAKNFINGVLLFGPPGTGKTMLAKAVAKESGARVLEVKGSEVYDMYVGEGEKNVKAIFSLARKLSPCVVFIDEVDTIFSSRNGSERHVSHREIINQFMAEWDGINALNSGVLILGATNRPFDLDDAILRRMPRRILVDLPTEEDRLAILKLLLVDEKLDPSVDLPALAKRTNLYSGSDLKNVCVSAALAAVTEEQASTDILGQSDTTSSEHVVELSQVESVAETEPAKRVLNARHFDKALTEVTASISESMETIELLRKFDREYGNAKEKKRKLMGFGSMAEESVASVRMVHS